MSSALTPVTEPNANAIAVPAALGWFELFQPLLQALHWHGDRRQLEEALSDSDALSMDMQQFRAVLSHMGFSSMVRHVSTQTLDERLLPAILLNDDGETPAELLTHPDQKLIMPEQGADLLMFQHITAPTPEMNGSIRIMMRRFHPILKQVMLISLLIGVLTLAPTFYNMAVYDHVIASGSSDGLFMLVVGVMLALAAEVALRHLRARRLGYFGARIDHYVSCSVFEHLLFLPPLYTERAPVSAQLARLRDFESVREFFTGPLATLFFEMPLVLMYLVVMVIVGGWLALVPAVLLLAYGVLLWVMQPRLKAASKAAASSGSKKHEFLLESVSKMRAVRLSGMEAVWQRRYRQLSADASLASFRASYEAQLLETLAYVLMMLGGIATLSFGVAAVIHQDLTTGALVASMMVIWRILTPMQMACASITRLQQLVSSTKQVERLLSVVPEHSPNIPVPGAQNMQGRLTFHRVSLKYSQESEPALLGVNFEAKQGQIIAIRGNNGSGKSSILKLTLGLYQPQSGSIRLDGVDIRQMDPLTLRQNIAYVPQNVDLFPGTLRENLQFAEPTASDEACLRALQAACAMEEFSRLPHGLDTLIEGEGAEPTSYMFRQRLNLARAYVKPSKIMLFDEPAHSLGAENDHAFSELLGQLRGRCTVLMVTHREDFMRLADVLLVLDKGELTHMGPPEQVITALRGKR